MEPLLERVRDSYEFPTDLAGDGEPGALGWTAATIALATVLLALTNAQSLRTWAEEMPPERPGVIALVEATTAWEERVAGLGLGRARLHKAWKRIEQARWTAPEPVVEEAALNIK
jgi:hypothetical protein